MTALSALSITLMLGSISIGLFTIVIQLIRIADALKQIARKHG